MLIADMQSLNVFNVRPLIIKNIQELQQSSNRNVTRNQSMVQQRANDGICTDPAKTLDLLRQILQSAINREIDAIIQSYFQNYFHPTVMNIKANLGDENYSLDLESMNHICRQILEEAKNLYPSFPSASPNRDVTCDVQEPLAKPLVNKNIPLEFRKAGERGDSDVESEVSHFSSSSSDRTTKRHRPIDQDLDHPSPPKIALTTPTEKQAEPLPVTEVHKLDISRLQANTLFVLGARANRALGLGSRRGIYSKHSDLFRYDVDAEDKNWLMQQNIQLVGKTFLMFYDDIRELLDSPEYEHDSRTRPKELERFYIPEFMLNKVGSKLQTVYENVIKSKQRSDNKGHSSRSSSRQDTPGSLGGHDSEFYH